MKWLTAFYLLIVSTCLATAAFISFGVNNTSGGGGGGNVTFTLPTGDVLYYIAASGGSDSYDGKEATHTTGSTGPWATPNHSVNCGDVILVEAGTYSGSVFLGDWGTVSSCPSSTGGLAGSPGGVYFAVVLCETAFACNISGAGGNGNGMQFTASNWAMEGFHTTIATNQNGCYSATSKTTSNINYNAFINDIADVCGAQGFFTVFGQYGAGSMGADMTAVVGAIAYNAASSLNYPCSSGISLIPTAGTGASGTHIFVAGYFGYDNVNAPSGATCNTDGEGIIFDSIPGGSVYPYQIVVEQSIAWGNGGPGFLIYPPGSNPDEANYYIFNSTGYGNFQSSIYSGGNGGEISMNLNNSSELGTQTITNNLLETTISSTNGTNGLDKMATFFASCNTTTCPTISYGGNWGWNSNPYGGVLKPATGSNTTSVGVDNTTWWHSGVENTTTWPYGTNTYGNPLFANPTGLPSSAPNCSGYANTTACMNTGNSVYADLTPSASGASAYGYQPPGSCTPDAYYPTWLKGIVYLHWDGTQLWENAVWSRSHADFELMDARLAMNAMQMVEG